METTTSAHETRITSGQKRTDERESPALRPRRLAEFIGQRRTCAVLSVMIEATAQRAKPLDHVLFYGPPGLGKTSLAHIIAQECRTNIRITSGPALKFAGELASILTRIEPGDVLFIDEAHRLNPKIEETLYPAMEDFALDLMLGKGATAREYRMSLPPFTIVGATTRLSLLSGPLRDRFGAHFRLDFYDVEELCLVIQRAAVMQGFPLDESATHTLASRARGTPRVALRLLRRVYDYATTRADGRITNTVAEEALALLRVDALGMEELDRRILRLLVEKFDGGPVGLETIAAAVSEDSATIMEVYEPYLLQLGFLARTPRGRVVTRHAYEHLGVAFPANNDQQHLL